MEYFTIDAYKDAPRVSEPYQVNGKLYTRVKCRCKRCGGSGIYQTFGTCYMCNGSGYNIVETRLFTAEEKAAFAEQKAEEEVHRSRLCAGVRRYLRVDRAQRHLSRLDNGKGQSLSPVLELDEEK